MKEAWYYCKVINMPVALRQMNGSDVADGFISLLLSRQIQNSLVTHDSLVPRFRQCQVSALRCQSDIQERRDERTGLSIAAAPQPINVAGHWTSRIGCIARRLPDLGNLKQQDEPCRAELAGA